MSNKSSFKFSKYRGLFNKWILFIFDSCMFTFANIAIWYIACAGNLAGSNYASTIFNAYHLIGLCVVTGLINYAFQLYKSVWSYAGYREIVLCFEAGIINAVVLCAVDKILFDYILNYSSLSLFIYVINALFLSVALVAPRIGYRILKNGMLQAVLLGNKNHNRKNVMIVGAGAMGNTIINEARTTGKFKAVVAVDDNPTKKGKKINGVKIAGTIDDIPRLAESYDVDEIIIAIPSASKKRQNEIVKIATSTSKKVKISSSLSEIISDPNSAKRLRNVEINDLLSRDEVKLDISVCKYLIDTTILVTGGGGSIGSEICKQCARYHPKTIVIFDIYENCAFELEGELKAMYGNSINIQVRIGSVRDINRLNEVFEEFQPDVVFHAAAHKHVPLMEDSPCEAVKNNVFGTYNVAVTADKFKVPKMVILSTDKAVNPTNVMGCTKRITEIIVQYMNEVSQNTQYAAVRFGNVLGSHGSVIPIFKKQIEKGGPVCVTHPDITRYFMTIPEAAQLVCQAGGLAKGGEVFVLDMGEPVKIMDLAENLIKLSGYTVDEIGIEITGLRPGEKLYEELSMDTEMATRQKTANEKIFVNHPMVINHDEFKTMLDSLRDINEDNVRQKLMEIVPNYHPAKND